MTGDLLARIRFQENDRPNIRIRWLNLLLERVVSLGASGLSDVTISGGRPDSDFGSSTVISGGTPNG